MKKLILFLVLLFVAVFTSACVNSYAVKQLNEIAIEYMDSGDTRAAIARLEASVDLDANVYESRYNLAVAYIRTGECEKALNNIKIAKTLRKDEEPAVYYTTGVAATCLADKIFEERNEKGEKIKIVYSDPEKNEKMIKKYIGHLTEANENFDKYTQLQPNASDTSNVLAIIETNKQKIAEKQSQIGG